MVYPDLIPCFHISYDHHDLDHGLDNCALKKNVVYGKHITMTS